MNRIITSIVLLLSLTAGRNSLLSARERVYLSTDKEYYLSGENIWCSVYCMDENGFSGLSSVAYLEFHSMEGQAATFKVALVEGRGCAKFEIPFTFKTGNYSIVAYTKRYGGDSVGEFNGKIVSIFNTLTSERVKGGVEVCDELPENDFRMAQNAGVAVEKVGEKSGIVSMRLTNNSDSNLSLNISVYNRDALEKALGENAYDRTLLLERTGEFEPEEVDDYEGEVIRARIVARNESDGSLEGKKVYLSAIGGEEVYTSVSDSEGYVTFLTNNIYGNREIVFDVESEGDYSVEPVVEKYDHKPAGIPVLNLSYELNEALRERSISMQISKRFEADTLYELSDMRINPLLYNRDAIIYRLDDYTRFPSMEEVIREYVKELRIRRVNRRSEIQVASRGDFNSHSQIVDRAFVLIDGVPVRDHSLVVGFDPLLVRELVIYPRQYLIGNVAYNGLVHFKTYKGDMGGLRQGSNVSIASYNGVAYPLALTGGKIHENEKYPNYNKTIYWNPAVTLKQGDSYEFECILPEYMGDFNVLVEGVDSKGRSIYMKCDLQSPVK